MGGTQHMVVVGVCQKDRMERAGSQNRRNFFCNGSAGKTKTRIVEDGGFSVIQKKGTVTGMDTHIRDRQTAHFSACSVFFPKSLRTIPAKEVADSTRWDTSGPQLARSRSNTHHRQLLISAHRR